MELTSFDSRKGQLKYISYFIKKNRKNYITKKIFFQEEGQWASDRHSSVCFFFTI